jgi:NACHT domain
VSSFFNEFGVSLAVDLSKQALASLAQYMGRWGVGVSSTQERLQLAIEAHTREVKAWSEEISFRDLARPKATSEVFVPLDIYLLPQRQHISKEERLNSAPLSSILKAEEATHLIILGQPGAGKTTALRHLCQEMLTGSETCPMQEFPLLIRFRDLNQMRGKEDDFSDLLIQRIQTILDITLDFPFTPSPDASSLDQKALRERAVVRMLELLRPVLLLDGLDEIPHKLKRDGIIAGVRQLALQLEKARVVLTARTGEFSYHVEKMTTYEIAPLSDAQIEQFAFGWLGVDDARTFLDQVRKSPFADTAIKPLTLAHLCAIFERVRRIPEKPKSVYKKFVTLLLEDWDQQRSVQRMSTYSDFEVDRKADFLADLAHELTKSNRVSTFSRTDLVDAYLRIHANYGLPKSDAQAVVNELETHTGLIVQSGSEYFEFSHKSLQEYLTAVFIVGLPSIPRNMIELQVMPNELAIATALSSRPSEYFYDLVLRHFSHFNLSFQFVRSFINRLLVERPDFELSVKIGLAILCLYSQYLRAWIEDAMQLQLFTFDPLSREFETLNALIRERLSVADLLGVYEHHSSSHGLDGQEIWRLERKKEEEGPFRLYSRGNILPQILWVRRSLIDEDGSADIGGVAS